MSERCHFDIDSLVSLSWCTCASLNPLRKSRYRWCNLGEEQTRNRWIEFTKVIYGLFYILWQQFLCSLLLFALVLCSLLPMIFFNAPCSLPSILTFCSQLPTPCRRPHITVNPSLYKFNLKLLVSLYPFISPPVRVSSQGTMRWQVMGACKLACIFSLINIIHHLY